MDLPGAKTKWGIQMSIKQYQAYMAGPFTTFITVLAGVAVGQRLAFHAWPTWSAETATVATAVAWALLEVQLERRKKSKS